MIWMFVSLDDDYMGDFVSISLLCLKTEFFSIIVPNSY